VAEKISSLDEKVKGEVKLTCDQLIGYAPPLEYLIFALYRDL